MPEASAHTRQVAETAFHAFAQGLATGAWEPFLALLRDDFQFWFPAGPFKGWHQGRDTARAFLTQVSLKFPEGLHLDCQQVTSNATTVVFEVRSHGTVQGQPYENQAAISFDIQGDQVSTYREYLGVIFRFGE